ncbi:unnamed protein product [Urochloa decumbens]|uniref:Uncharacterized protein n=1 Tax=Urochloa decumbens TaxID=240449 RepID=A0ABC9AG79_9POAL
MATEPAAPLSMKLLVDTKAGRVLYAEAGKDVVDFLFSILALPLATVTKLLTAGVTGSASSSPPDNAAAKLPTAGGAMVGSVGNLHRSVAALDAGHVCRRGARDALLEPAVLHLTAAAPAAPAAPVSVRLFRCKGCSCSPGCYNYATSVRGTPCPVCKAKMATEVQLVLPDGGAAAAAGEGSSVVGYVRDMVTYTVMDDLTVAPMSTIGAGLALLKASLQSETVLTDVFLGRKQSCGARAPDLGSRSPCKFRGTF